MTGVTSYLDVRYRAEARPYTAYPTALTEYLTKTHLGAPAGRRLLDLGCGRGEFLHEFRVLGFDVSGVDRARPVAPRFPERVEEVDYERAPLPFEDGTFDVVFNKSVLEHVTDISRVLGEARRVLKPGGRMVSMVPDWRAQWRHFYDDWTHTRPFTLTGLSECLRCHGFEVRVAQRFRQLPFLWHRPWLRIVADVAAVVPSWVPQSKLVRFSKEWMLLVVADRPDEHEPCKEST